MMQRFLIIALSLLSLLGNGPALAQNYPTRPITMIVGYGAGGSTDLAARIVASHMEKTLGQPVIIENKVGGNGAVGTRAVFTAKPDGYTIGMTSGSILTVLPYTTDLGFDPLKLTFIGSTHESYYALWVRADSRFKTIQDVVSYAKANPDKLVTANSGGFGIPDIAVAQLAQANGGFTYRTVPTSGGAEQVLKLLAGDVELEANSATATLSHMRDGKIRAVLIVSTGWPELEKLGVPQSSKLFGFTARNLASVVGPPGLPEPIRQRLEDALKKAMEDPDVHARLVNTGELIEFKTGKAIAEVAAKAQAEQYLVAKQLGKAIK
jgi:tripartite-type tricarboxylate transporter receptor subunit TctC